MARVTYTQQTITGPVIMKRTIKQGRREKIGEKRIAHSYTTENEAEFEIIKLKAKQWNMSVARYVALAAVMYEPPELN